MASRKGHKSPRSLRSIALSTGSCLVFLVSIALLICFVFPCFAQKKGTEKVTIHFVEVDLTAVTKFISEITGKNFIFDERAKGKISIIAPSKLTVEEAFNLFTSVLELKGFTVLPSGVNTYKIIPAAEAKQRGILRTAIDRVPINESYIARLIPLKFIPTDEALKFLQPLVSRDGHISVFGPGQLLLVVDSGLNMEKILALIGTIDLPSVREKPELIPLKHASADVVAKILMEGLSKARGRVAPGQPPLEEGVGVIADPRLNAVILFGEKGIRESMRGLIALIDSPSPEAQARINVYFLEHADATELSKVLEGIIRGIQPARQAGPGVPGAAVTPFEAAAGISITPDKSTNSLVIVASPADYRSLLQVLKQLDRRRNQVFVEAMITEVSIDRLLELGSRWRAAITKDEKPIVIGGFGPVDASTIQSIVTGLTGLAVGGMGNYLTIPQGLIPGATADITFPVIAGLFSLDEFKGAINILSNPQVLTSDNKEAEIVVGENVPFITKREADPSRPTSVFSTIERKDVGITLRITPQITEGDYVKLDIYQEISAVKQESEVVQLSVGPTTIKRSTKTSVVVKDRQTVVIGGLMQEREEESLHKVPLLGDIPLLGWFFKYRTTSKKKTNLLVFITPHMVRDAEQLAQLSEGKVEEFPYAKGLYVEGEIFLKFKEEISPEKAMMLISQKGATVKRYMKYSRVYLVQLKRAQTVEDGIKEFSAMPEVEYAEPNFQVKVQGLEGN
ncbi:MAG: type II secretion system secretin GspD [candidate division NC10 bacterium]|nr:type II secretion system secretin GspD [candidate division NC10 bacterium]